MRNKTLERTLSRTNEQLRRIKYIITSETPHFTFIQVLAPLSFKEWTGQTCSTKIVVSLLDERLQTPPKNTRKLTKTDFVRSIECLTRLLVDYLLISLSLHKKSLRQRCLLTGIFVQKVL